MTSARKGQGSIEFLMTYGWIILAIIIVMVVMWQWGLFDFSNQIDPGSFGFWGVVIQSGNEFILDSKGNMQVSVLNTVGANVTVLSVNISINGHQMDCDPPAGDSCIYIPSVDVENPGDWGNDNNVIPPGRTRRISLSDNARWANTAGTRFDARITIQYNDSRTGESVYQSSGTAWGNIEPG